MSACNMCVVPHKGMSVMTPQEPSIEADAPMRRRGRTTPLSAFELMSFMAMGERVESASLVKKAYFECPYSRFRLIDGLNGSTSS
ncbi:hypothetical protein M8818_003963 [Zalaria obscura]|uniref:Uncharacterized protein n=1 Tax=Zalaria obscura TaxID=2024903 RepID=A0ACC3SD72_9PEZI